MEIEGYERVRLPECCVIFAYYREVGGRSSCGNPVNEVAAAKELAVRERGLTGHAEVPFHGSHWDPGKGFPWDWYLEKVEGYYKELHSQ